MILGKMLCKRYFCALNLGTYVREGFGGQAWNLKPEIKKGLVAERLGWALQKLSR